MLTFFPFFSGWIWNELDWNFVFLSRSMKPRLTKAKRIATAKRTEKRAELFAKYDQDIGTLGHWGVWNGLDYGDYGCHLPNHTWVWGPHHLTQLVLAKREQPAVTSPPISECLRSGFHVVFCLDPGRWSFKAWEYPLKPLLGHVFFDLRLDLDGISLPKWWESRSAIHSDFLLRREAWWHRRAGRYCRALRKVQAQPRKKRTRCETLGVYYYGEKLLHRIYIIIL